MTYLFFEYFISPMISLEISEVDSNKVPQNFN
jgi:hypothetical protein